MTEEVAPIRDRVVSLRFTEGERAALEKRAAAVGVSLSELIRRTALATLYPDPPARSAGTFTTSAPLTRIRFEETP